ncbi:MAG: prepilin-type N-terminal cleavage/methylation domain-containing protein [Candidatus Eisenbacteria bacterium]|uniref:Prepilin-type N-terminal cleavage/methylation domain-containing protein n=1 Tax=Eiseniibacteriota bacterium TaxID=2212470 RepID=A0A9D6L8S2_UNCEI|nr:prepilin-type N-terminal cleavage/methylation domain-containing protein [Candidatus Eisenbacteria bacterium]MBI3538743.1 prepilin-type N-terminal cleavage/methylation domain-containing protein [Candidatus Eisenbacteria bacterium]
MTRRLRASRARERGASLVELMIALVVLSLGILAMARLFPAGTRSQLQTRMTTTASFYTQEKIEDLSRLPWGDASLTDGRHPAGVATENLGSSGAWHRFYNVTTMGVPLDNLKKVTVTVAWSFVGARQVQATTYLRR